MLHRKWPDKKWVVGVFEGLLKNNRSSIIDAFWILTSSDDKIKNQASELLHLSLPAVDLKKLDAEFRQRTSFEWSIDWRNQSPHHLIPAHRHEDEKITILGLSTLHPNGYFREKAIKELIQFENDRVFPFLILRTNDWVPAVRTLAKKALLDLINESHITAIIQNLILFNQLKYTERENHQDILDAIKTSLSNEKSKEAVKIGLGHANPRIRYLCSEILIGNRGMSNSEIISYLSSEKIPFVRYLLISSLIKSPDIIDFDLIKHLLDKEKCAKNKKMILGYAHQNYKQDCIPLFTEAVFDTQKSVRAFARTILSESDNIDFLGEYRNALKDGSKILGAIGGISELGESSDAKTVAQYLQHDRIRIVREALKCIAKLDLDVIESNLIKFLSDKSEGISKDAKKILLNNINIANEKEIYDQFQKTEFEHVRINSLKILFSLSKWDAIYYILHIGRSSDEKISKNCHAAFLSWQGSYNMSYTIPSEAQIARVKNALSVLDENTRSIMLFTIKSFEKA